MPLAAAVATVAVLLQGGASQAQTVASKPTAKQLAAQATQLSNEESQLDQQYDGLKLQLAQANSQAKFAEQAEKKAEASRGCIPPLLLERPWGLHLDCRSTARRPVPRSSA